MYCLHNLSLFTATGGAQQFPALMVAVLEDFTRCSLRRGILYMHTAIAIVTALGLRDRHMFPLPYFRTNSGSTTKPACSVLSEACRLSAQLEHCKGLRIAIDCSGLLRIAFSYMVRVVI